MNMKKMSLLLAVLLALCSCAYAETAEVASTAAPVEAAETAPLTAGDITGLWDLEYVTSAGFMVQAEAYGLVITLTLQEDGAAVMDYNGEIDGGMTWYIQDGSAYIRGYNDDGDVEILLNAAGVLEITDDIGTMIFTRPVAEAAE